MDEKKVMDKAQDVIRLKKKVSIWMSESGVAKRIEEKKIIK